MKRLLLLTLLCLPLSFLNAQLRYELRGIELTRSELVRLRADQLRYQHLQRKVIQDGVITTRERKRLYRLKIHTRREAIRRRHRSQIH